MRRGGEEEEPGRRDSVLELLEGRGKGDTRGGRGGGGGASFKTVTETGG